MKEISRGSQRGFSALPSHACESSCQAWVSSLRKRSHCLGMSNSSMSKISEKNRKVAYDPKCPRVNFFRILWWGFPVNRGQRSRSQNAKMNTTKTEPGVFWHEKNCGEVSSFLWPFVWKIYEGQSSDTSFVGLTMKFSANQYHHNFSRLRKPWVRLNYLGPLPEVIRGHEVTTGIYTKNAVGVCQKICKKCGLVAYDPLAPWL